MVKIGLVEDGSGLPGFPGVGGSTPGGGAFDLARALSEAGHSVTFYARGSAEALSLEPRSGLTLRPVYTGPPRPLEDEDFLPHVADLAQGLAALWRRERPDVVHTHSWTAALAALAARRHVEVPIVQTLSTRAINRMVEYAPRERSRIRQLGWQVCRNVQHLTVGCYADLNRLMALGISRHRVTVVPRGVDLNRFTPSGPAYPPRGGRARLLTVGVLDPHSGLDVTIQALSALPRAELILVAQTHGQDGKRELRRLADTVAKHGIAGRIRLFHRISLRVLPSLIRAADIVLCTPSRPAETVELEAMACGKPVIATEVGSLAESVIDGVTGSLVRPGRASDLATAVRHLLGDRLRLQGYGMTAGEHASARYSWTRVVLDMTNLYIKVGCR